jgi:L-lactate permease
MEMGGQVHAPAALPPTKEPQVPTEWESGWQPNSFWTAWVRDGIQTPAENRTQDLLVHSLVTALSRVRIQRMNGPELVGILAPHWSLAIKAVWIISFRNKLSKFLRPVRDSTVGSIHVYIAKLVCFVTKVWYSVHIWVVCSVNELFDDIL